MPSENLDETEVDDENEDAKSDDSTGDPYSIDVNQALSKDIRGGKQPDPIKVDKAQRLGFDLGIDPATLPPKQQITV